MVFDVVSNTLGRIMPLLYAFTGFCALIIIHELGHFLFCKLFGIHTPTFSIGVGPTVFERQWGTTKFRLAALPIGGYVEIAGNAEPGQGHQEFAQSRDATSFAVKPYWQKLLVMVGGILFNLLFAYIATIILLGYGTPKTAIFIKKLTPESPATLAGMREGDQLLSWNEVDIQSNPSLLSKQIEQLRTKEAVNITLVVRRNDNAITLHIPLAAPEADSEKKPRLGIERFEMLPSGEEEKFSFPHAIAEGISRTNQAIVDTVQGIISLISRGSISSGAGPILIIAESAKQAKHSLASLLKFLAIISINLAIINLIPVPMLDGGQIMFVTIESIIRRPIPERVKHSVLVASFLLLGLLLILFTINDIRSLIGI